MEKRYHALRMVASIYRVLGIIAGILTVLVMVGTCLAAVLGGAAMDSAAREFGRGMGMTGVFSGFVGAAITSIILLIWGGGAALTLYGIGEGIYLLLALEENTRATVNLLQPQQGDPESPRLTADM